MSQPTSSVSSSWFSMESAASKQASAAATTSTTATYSSTPSGTTTKKSGNSSETNANDGGDSLAASTTPGGRSVDDGHIVFPELMMRADHMNSSPQPQPQIRHAGRAHIRGKIRRVWRPRYLELFDNGLVRYYELPAAADIALHCEADWNHVNMVPRYTLAIFDARILDVTTLRDIHVGLPRGSFGFLFRGQRLLHLETAEASQTMNGVLSIGVGGGGGMGGINLGAVGVGVGGSGIGIVGGPQAGVSSACTEVVKEQRDFLCAVSTLEEAQSWVVALQWAASQRQTTNVHNVVTEPWWNDDAVAVEGVDDYGIAINFDEHADSPARANTTHDTTTTAAAALLSAPLTPQKQTRQPPSSLPNQLSPTPQRPIGTYSQSHHRRTPGESAFRSGPAGRAPGKVVVSKVVQYRTVRTAGYWSFEIAYEIHGMLLKQRKAEQWSILRTADDFQLLISNLCKELGPSLLDRAQLGPMRQLPRLRDRPTEETLQASLSVVDSILRSLVMDAAMVNATAMKAFLGLSSTSTSSTEQRQQSTRPLALRWWRTHDPATVLERQVGRVPDGVTTDQFVKQWLLQRNDVPQSVWDARAAALLQRPLMVIGSLTLSTVVLGPLSHVWQVYWCPPTVTVRLDVLLVSWVGAAYLGQMIPLNNGTRSSPSAASSKKGVSSSSSSKGNAKGHTKPTSPPRVNATATSASASTAQTSSATKNKGLKTKTNAPTSPLQISRSDSQGSEVLVKDDGEDVVSRGSVPSLPVEAEDDHGIGVVNTGLHLDVDDDDDESDGEVNQAAMGMINDNLLTSPLPQYPDNDGCSCWSKPPAHIFHVRGANYLKDRVKIPSEPGPLTCRGVDVWMTDNPERHIARHPAVLGGKLREKDTFLVNFLLPFANFVAYFSIPPLEDFPDNLRPVWTNFLKGDQQYRDARLKLLPVVMDGPWIVKAAVGPGKSPALLGKVIPLQYFFHESDGGKNGDMKDKKKAVYYEVDVIITASTIAKGILSVIKGHTKSVSIAFALIIEASKQEELPETVLCTFQVHSLHLEDCPPLPPCNLP